MAPRTRGGMAPRTQERRQRTNYNTRYEVFNDENRNVYGVNEWANQEADEDMQLDSDNGMPSRIQIGRRQERNNVSRDVFSDENPNLYGTNEGINQEVQVEMQLDSDDVVNRIDKENNGHDGVAKKKRGPTFMTELWGRPKCLDRIEVEFNETGVPIGDNAAKLNEFLGTVVRNGKDALIDIMDWRLVPAENKLRMINMVKNIFDLPPGTEDWVYKSMGKKWRSFKADLKDKYFDPSLPVSAQLAFGDERLIQEQFVRLLEYGNTEKGQHRSEKNKQARACNKMNHCIGKKSYGRIRNELEKKLGRPASRAELFKKCYTHANGEPSGSEVATALGKMTKRASQLSPDSMDSVSPNDIFAQVLGKEKRGRVRMFGSNVPATDEWGQLPSKSASYRIIHEQNLELQRMNEKLKEQESRFEEQGNLIQQLNAAVAQLRVGSPMGFPTSSNSNIPSLGNGQVISSATHPRRLTVRASVSLKSLNDPNKIVAKGYIVDMNPQKNVGGHVLGPNWCEVNIQVVTESEEHLIRPYSLLETIGDALGTNIAWPKSLVERNAD